MKIGVPKVIQKLTFGAALIYNLFCSTQTVVQCQSISMIVFMFSSQLKGNCCGFINLKLDCFQYDPDFEH